MYESKIGDARWIAYDLPGNAGWIAFLAGLILCAVKRPEITGNNAISAFLILNLLCAAAMVVGVIELISERIQKLDRAAPRRRLYRGFGALTFGGACRGGLFLACPGDCVDERPAWNMLSWPFVRRRVAVLCVRRVVAPGIQETVKSNVL